MKKRIVTIVEWDFTSSNESQGCAQGLFKDANLKNKEHKIFLNGFQITTCHGKINDRRSVCLELFQSSRFGKLSIADIANVLIFHHHNEIAQWSHTSGQIHWVLGYGESVTDAAVRIAKALVQTFNMESHTKSWTSDKMISWFTVLQHTLLWQDNTWISEEVYLRRKHCLPEIYQRQGFTRLLNRSTK